MKQDEVRGGPMDGTDGILEYWMECSLTPPLGRVAPCSRRSRFEFAFSPLITLLARSMGYGDSKRPTETTEGAARNARGLEPRWSAGPSVYSEGTDRTSEGSLNDDHDLLTSGRERFYYYYPPPVQSAICHSLPTLSLH